MAVPLRVLMVEDDPDDAELVISELHRGGFALESQRVDSEASLREALDGGDWDIILSDYAMPGFGLPGVLSFLRERGLHTPVIVISGTIDEEQAVTSLRNGARDFVSKQRLARLCPAVRREIHDADTERARTRAEGQVRVAEERFQRLVETIPAVTYVAALDEVGSSIYVSPQITALLGFTREEWLAEPDRWSKQLHPEDRTRVLAQWSKAVDTGRFHEDYRLLTKDAQVRWVEDEAVLVHDEGGEWRFQGLLFDVSGRKQAEEEIRHQREALHRNERLVDMGTLLAGVAHELNNPLAVVVGQSMLLRRAAGEGPLALRADTILNAADRCAHIVRKLLSLAHQHPPERRLVSLNQVVQDAVELLAYALRVDNVEVSLALAKTLPAIWADAHELHQVLINLLINARHALQKAPDPRRITLASQLEAPSGRIILEITDTGPGIPAEILARIFDPFFTTKPAGEGTGLGLPLCRGIVEAHGGTLTVANAPGSGARFRIELPGRTPAETVPPPVSPSAPPPPRTYRILVVDDETAVSTLLLELLGEDGHKVDVASTVEAALAKLATQTFDLVFSDLRMPGRDGLELWSEARQRHPHLANCFVFLTGGVMSASTHQLLEQTGLPCVEKPFSLEAIRAVIRESLERPPVP